MGRHRSKLKVAVVGAGPSGIYAADALASQETVLVEIDLLERLPTPFGLVRYGVAPDHPNIKSLVESMSDILMKPSIRFVGGVEIGSRITPHDLRRCYDAIIYATGAREDRKLGIPGENLSGVIPATQFVSWYNGHPDAESQIQLRAQSVIVIGAGNVALDLGRILTRPARDFKSTDVPQDVLRELEKNETKDVHLIARRGPEHVKFTSRELRELEEIPSVAKIIESNALTAMAAADSKLTRRARTNMELMRKWGQQRTANTQRRLNFKFFKRPVEVLGREHVEAVRFERTEIDVDGHLRGQGTYVTLAAQLVVPSIGHRALALPGLPFNEVDGVVPSCHGRVIGSSGAPLVGEYVTGWLRRGPTGVVGTNKADAGETVASLVADYESGSLKTRECLDFGELMRARRIRTSGLASWRSIDWAERTRGIDEGRDRSKIADWATLIDLVESVQDEERSGNLARRVWWHT